MQHRLVLGLAASKLQMLIQQAAGRSCDVAAALAPGGPAIFRVRAIVILIETAAR